MKVIALINPAAGGVGLDGDNRMRRALASNGLRDAVIVRFDPADSDIQLRDLAAAQPDLFIVWGGDGTHRTALRVLGREPTNLLLLRGGTMGLLAKALHGDKPWQQILRAVATAPKRKVLSAGEINDDVFYCAMLAGAPARFAEARESLRHGNVGKAVHDAQAALEAVGSLHLIARYGVGHSRADRRLPATSVIGALVGPLSRTGRMEVATLPHPSVMSALDAVWSSFLSGWHDAPGVTVVPADTLMIDSEDGDDIPVIVDGETIKVGPRLRVTYVEDAAQCLVAG
jgi:diacylglycerol kinase family enzyme